MREIHRNRGYKPVGLLLGLAILYAPYAFCWVLLRDGYSPKARKIAFGWAAIFVIFLALAFLRNS